MTKVTGSFVRSWGRGVVDERYTELSCEEFADRLAAREGVPGGGGAAALVGALGVALCSMAGSFTVGKPRYADVEDEVRALMDEAEDVRYRLVELVEEDAEGFAPLAAAYAIPRDDPGRAEALERATEAAAMAPLAMVGECCRAVTLLERMGERCSRLLASDVACGALLVRAALGAASVNVYVNTSALADRAQAAAIESACDELVEEYVPRAERLAERVLAGIRGGLR